MKASTIFGGASQWRVNYQQCYPHGGKGVSIFFVVAKKPIGQLLCCCYQPPFQRQQKQKSWSASVERFGVSCMRDFFLQYLLRNSYKEKQTIVVLGLTKDNICPDIILAITIAITITIISGPAFHSNIACCQTYNCSTAYLVTF